MEDKQQKKETITTQQKNTIEDYDLDLSLNIRPLNSPSSLTRVTKNINVPSKPNGQNLKRKAIAQNDAVILERHLKVMNSGLQSSFKGHNGNFVGKNEGGGDGAGGSSSGNSDSYHSNNSNAGGSSSDTSSHSSQPRVKLPISPQEKTHLIYSNHNQCSRKLPSTDTIPKPTKTWCNEKCAFDKEPIPTARSPGPKESKLVIGKPPKPNRQLSQQSVLPQMPCVSTTGNGPNGKSITGFLYKYSKTEVSIICVCHGTSFSPSGFIEHAGGVDVEHPLKHIRVVPFAVN